MRDANPMAPKAMEKGMNTAAGSTKLSGDLFFRFVMSSMSAAVRYSSVCMISNALS